MAVIRVTYYTDPACPWSWGAEPALRRLVSEFGDQVAITSVMAGLAREFKRPHETALHVLEAAARTRMPVDARLWLEHPPRSSFPACLAVKAAAEQGLDGRFLRRAREGLMVGRRALDTPEALTEIAHDVAGLDVARFASDLGSSAIVEAFGADVERARGVSLPTFEIDGVRHQTVTPRTLVDAATAAGAQPGPHVSVADALARFGRMATPEVAAVCDLPGPLAPAELWRLAAEHRLAVERVGGGELWSSV